MSGFLIVLAVVLAAGLHGLFTVKFRQTVCMYLFVFIPGYLLFREYYVRMTGDFPDALKAVKDFVWVYVLSCFFVVQFLSPHKCRMPRSLLITLAIFITYLIVQFVRSHGTLGGFGSILSLRNTLMYVPAVFFAQYVIRNKSDIFKLVRYFSYVMIVAAVYGLIQMGLRMPTTYSILSPANTTVKFLYSSFFPDYNMLGWFSAVTFGLVFPFRRFYGSDRLLTRAALIFSVFWLVAAQSRTAIISLGAVLFVLFVFGRLKPGRLLIIAAIAVGVLFLFWSGILLHHRLRGGVLGDLRFTQAWPVLWAVYKSRPFFGYGFGVFGFAALREGIDIIGLRGRAGVGVDNFYLTLLLNTGLFGLLLFAALVFTVLNRLRAIVKLGRDRPTTDFLIGIFLGIVVCLVYGIPTNLLEGFPVGVYFWFLVGCSFSAYANEMGCQSPRSEVIERSSRRVVC